MKLTPWFSGDQKPVRMGVYQRAYADAGEKYCYWDGQYWGSPTVTAKGADHWSFATNESIYQNLPWRGVMK